MYCINSIDATLIIRYLIFDTPSNDNTKNLISLSQSWNYELIVCAYNLSISLLNIKKDPINDTDELTEKVYDLQKNMYLSIHSLDMDFVEYMLNHTKMNDLNLEENLNDLLYNLKDFNYDRTVRY